MTMREHSGRPFDSIESSHEYVALLLQAIEEAADDVGEDLGRTDSAGTTRRHQAFQLIAYKLDQLRFHLGTGRRLLNDLRTLRRLLHGERGVDGSRPLSPPIAHEDEGRPVVGLCVLGVAAHRAQLGLA